MRLVLLDGGDQVRAIGAAVVRSDPSGSVVLELGPADGPPHLRLTLDNDEAIRLAATLEGAAHGRGEVILIVED